VKTEDVKIWYRRLKTEDRRPEEMVLSVMIVKICLLTGKKVKTDDSEGSPTNCSVLMLHFKSPTDL
jgi:hypothetical protein